MNFRVPKSTFKVQLYNRQDSLIVVLTKKDPTKEEWGDYDVELTVVPKAKKA